MTSSENSLALCILKENFGETAHLVAGHLIAKKSYPLVLIAADLNLDKKRVAQVLTTLLIHNLAEYKLNSKQLIEYKLVTKNVLNMLKHPWYVKQADEFVGVGKTAGLIVHELLLNGYAEMSSVVLRVVAKLGNDELSDESQRRDAKKIGAIYDQVRESFGKLVANEFLERVVRLESKSGQDAHKETMDTTTAAANTTSAPAAPKLERIPRFANSNEERFEFPSIKIDSSRLLKAVEEGSSKVAACLRKPNENFGDNEIYWRVNEQRFIQIFRDKSLIDAIEHRIDKNTATILKVILKSTDSKILPDKALPYTTQSKTVTLIDIQKELKSELQMDTNLIDRYLGVLLLDSFKVLERIGDFGGGAYAIDFKKAFHNLCLAHIESYIREKHGSKSLRIFRVILDKSQLEQKQIEDFSMIPSKDCKALLYAMLNDGLLTITELSKTSDHAPSRTFYLFTVNVYNVCKKLLENAYKSMKNLLIKRDFLTAENKRLLEKNKKINTLVESLKSQGAEQTEIDDVRAMMSCDEVKMLSCVNDHCQKIELAELQLTQMICTFEIYFYYHTIAPVIQVGRGGAMKAS